MKISEIFKPGKIKSWQGLRPLFKKALASLAAVALVCSVVPLVSWAAVGDTFTKGQLTYTVLTEGNGNNTVSVRATNEQINGDIEIPETVKVGGLLGFGGTEYKVTTIGEQAFSACTSLTSITIPNSVTSIGARAFAGCTSLKIVTIGTSATTIDKSAFDGCTSLTSLIILDARGVGATFTQGQLTYTILTEGNGNNTVSVKAKDKSISGDITIPGTVKNGGMFGTEYRVTDINGSAFVLCKGLKSIDIPDSVTLIGKCAFSHCASLTKVTIPNSVTLIGECAFSYCASLTKVTIPNSVTLIGWAAFADCTNLIEVTMGDSVKKIEWRAFKNCTNLNSINIPDSATTIDEEAFKDCTNLTSINIPDSVTTIGEGAFSNCKNLTKVTIGKSVTSIGKQAFAFCKSLTSIDIPNSVTSIGKQAFAKCTSLTSINIPDSVTKIGERAFEGCSSLGTIKISNQIANNKKNIFWTSGIYLDTTYPHKYTIDSKEGEFVYIFDRNKWGEKKEENGVTYYVADDGTTSTEIIGDGITWLKEESGGTSA